MLNILDMYLYIYINRSKPLTKKFAKWIKSCRAFRWARRAPTAGAKGYSLPQELEKACEAGYFSSRLIRMK